MSRKNDRSSKKNCKAEISIYEQYFEEVLVKEQPFYRQGMTKKEIKKELKYLNNNLEAFYNGSYKPLWKQNI